jgi:rhodanese-related sulfurtransferase
VAQKFLEKGFENVYALRGGWHEWLDSQYPIEKK